MKKIYTQKSRRTLPKSPEAKMEEVIARMHAKDSKRQAREERGEEVELIGDIRDDLFMFDIPSHLQTDTRPKKKCKTFCEWLSQWLP